MRRWIHRYNTEDSGRVQVPRESVYLEAKRAFPYASTVEGDLGERRLAQRFPTRSPDVDPRLRAADVSERLGCLNVAGIEE